MWWGCWSTWVKGVLEVAIYLYIGSMVWSNILCTSNWNLQPEWATRISWNHREALGLVLPGQKEWLNTRTYTPGEWSLGEGVRFCDLPSKFSSTVLIDLYLSRAALVRKGIGGQPSDGVTLQGSVCALPDDRTLVEILWITNLFLVRSILSWTTGLCE